MLAGARYFLSGPLRWCEIDGDWVVYCIATGSLRQADAPTAAVLATLEDGPASAGTIAQRITDATEAPLDEDVLLGIAGLLEDLQRTGFVEGLVR